MLSSKGRGGVPTLKDIAGEKRLHEVSVELRKLMKKRKKRKKKKKKKKK